MRHLREAHMRMMTALAANVRTVRARQPGDMPGLPKRNHARAAQPILIDGVRYPSVTHACRALHLGRLTIVKRLREGTAKYEW